ncbi:MAG: hypothetical protein ABL925_06290 [Methylococcales bacterium]
MKNPHLQRAKMRHAQIKEYAKKIGKTRTEWMAITSNPALFNQLWRKMLRLSPSDMPPSKEYRR